MKVQYVHLSTYFIIFYKSELKQGLHFSFSGATLSLDYKGRHQKIKQKKTFYIVYAYQKIYCFLANWWQTMMEFWPYIQLVAINVLKFYGRGSQFFKTLHSVFFWDSLNADKIILTLLENVGVCLYFSDRVLDFYQAIYLCTVWQKRIINVSIVGYNIGG